jgi:hypothetical protein
MHMAAPWFAPILLAVEPNPKRALSKPTRGHAFEGYVLKLNGKVVSDRKLQLRAFAWVADDLAQRGHGGGIVELLRPRTELQLRRLVMDRKKYTLEAVRGRDGGRRKSLRDQALSPDLLLALLAVCPAQPGWKRRQFVEWLVREMRNVTSDARGVIAAHAPDLLMTMRSYAWWYRLLGTRKMSR